MKTIRVEEETVIEVVEENNKQDSPVKNEDISY